MDLNNNNNDDNNNDNNNNDNNNNANENIPEPPQTPAQPQTNAPGRVCPGAPVRRPRRPEMHRRNLTGVRKIRKLQNKNCSMAARALFKSNDDDKDQDDDKERPDHADRY